MVVGESVAEDYFELSAMPLLIGLFESTLKRTFVNLQVNWDEFALSSVNSWYVEFWTSSTPWVIFELNIRKLSSDSMSSTTAMLVGGFQSVDANALIILITAQILP